MRPAPRDQEVTIEDVTGLSGSFKLLLKPYLFRKGIQTFDWRQKWRV